MEVSPAKATTFAHNGNTHVPTSVTVSSGPSVATLAGEAVNEKD